MLVYEKKMMCFYTRLIPIYHQFNCNVVFYLITLDKLNSQLSSVFAELSSLE